MVQHTNIELGKAQVPGNHTILGDVLLFLAEAERQHLLDATVAITLALAALEVTSTLVLASLEDAIDEDIDRQARGNITINIQDNRKGSWVLWHSNVGFKCTVVVLCLVLVKLDTIRLDFDPTLEIAQARHDGVFDGYEQEKDSFKGLKVKRWKEREVLEKERL
jgi:hypothetical protein